MLVVFMLILKLVRVNKKIMEMERRYGGDYVHTSNILASVGRYSDVERLRIVMDKRIVFKLLAIVW